MASPTSAGSGRRVVLASLAPHLQLAGPPIDVIEFQGDHLARPQPQAGQQEEDGAIAAGGGAVPLASTDDPFDLFGGEVLRQFGEPPLRHGRDGPREVALRLPAAGRGIERRSAGRSPSSWPLAGLPERACRKRKREMSSAARSRTRIGPSPKRSTRKRRTNCQ